MSQNEIKPKRQKEGYSCGPDASSSCSKSKSTNDLKVNGYSLARVIGRIDRKRKSFAVVTARRAARHATASDPKAKSLKPVLQSHASAGRGRYIIVLPTIK
jgi:hypothetical protein